MKTILLWIKIDPALVVYAPVTPFGVRGLREAGNHIYAHIKIL